MIQRDGHCTSLWQNGETAYKPAPITDTKDFDVIVAGGGITGISTALLMAERGKRCLVLEARELCFGTTGGTTAHINTLLDTPYATIAKNFGKDNAKATAQAAQDALQLIRSNVSRLNIDCGFSEADAYLFAQNGDQDKTLQQLLDATVDAGVEAFAANNIPLPIPFTTAMRVKGQAKFHPVKYVFALARAFESLGGAILQQTRVTGVENNADGVTVETSQGRFVAKDLIYATHIPPGVNLLHLRCVPYRSYAMAVTLSDEAYPEDLSYDMEDPYHYYRTQMVNGQPYLIAGGKDHKTGETANAAAHFTQLESHIRKYFNVKEISYKWSSQYFEPADGLPYIGHLPGQQEHIYVATGFGGNGMTYSNVAAILLRDLVAKGAAQYETLFDPNRIKPVAGFKSFISHNADVVKQFVSKLLPHEDLKQLADMAPGEGKVVSYEDEKIAIHKDGKGGIHAVSPVCTHLQCEVKWNNAELSWDCPCHGARYDPDGNVLTGPASMSLEAAPMEKALEHSKK
ncbi:FAD-dependent oxidoreductase [Chitinophaga sp. GCM10012297]|uniref:FAD-dependent oxidoreductase n=1 Tax=Chitinophaga chungangae TaxID=2821488 RepID=A0ABS3YF38_9BACT|nr:FAD-dependent oxidoreductase [Chitinophaga chungangae]MBO9153070.1 FAD-dependent oxidoreductase [Chitinophaga chungangae]